MRRLYMYKSHKKNDKHNYKVYDYEGDVCYFLNGRWGRIEDRVILYDPSGDERLRAVQVLLSFFPKFELTSRGDFIGNLTKHVTFNKQYYTISHLDWTILCNFENQEYRIIKNHKKLAHIKKSIGYQGDCFFIAVYLDEYEALYCLLATLLDYYSPNYDLESPMRLVKDSKYSSFLFPNFELKDYKKNQSNK